MEYVHKNDPRAETPPEARIKGKYLQSIDAVIGQQPGKRIIFLFNYFDCEPCVNAGFYLCKRIRTAIKECPVYAVASMVDPASYQQKNACFEYVYSDEEDKIRKELKFAPTPLLILLSENNKIPEAYIPRDTVACTPVIGAIQKQSNNANS